MPWHVAKSARCAASKPWAVIKDADGSVEGCHPTEEKAKAHMAALYANTNDIADIVSDAVKTAVREAARRHLP